MKKENNVLITNLRAIAILVVIIGHSIIIYDTMWGFYTSNNKSLILEYLKHIIDLFQMPLFFSISGFCFYYSKELIIQKKIRRLLVPFLIILLFWVIPFRLISNYPLYENNSILEVIIKGLIGKDCGHLWYLMSLFEMYIIFNVFVKINNKSISIIFVLIVFLLSLKVSILPNYLQLQSTFKYFIFFIIGYYLNKYNVKISKKVCIIFLIILFFLGTTYLCVNLKTKLIIKGIEFLFPLLVIGILYNMIPNKNYNTLNYISKNSFGLYLFHSPMLYPVFNYAANINIILMLFNNIFIIPSLCLFLIKIIKKLKLSFIIGE